MTNTKVDYESLLVCLVAGPTLSPEVIENYFKGGDCFTTSPDIPIDGRGARLAVNQIGEVTIEVPSLDGVDRAFGGNSERSSKTVKERTPN